MLTPTIRRRESIASREVRIGFVLGALAGAGAALVWTSKPERLTSLLGRIDRTAETIETRISNLDRFVGEMTGLVRDQANAISDLATNTTQRFDGVTDVVQKNLVHSILELGSFFKEVKPGLDRLFPKHAA